MSLPVNLSCKEKFLGKISASYHIYVEKFFWNIFVWHPSKFLHRAKFLCESTKLFLICLKRKTNSAHALGSFVGNHNQNENTSICMPAYFRFKGSPP